MENDKWKIRLSGQDISEFPYFYASPILSKDQAPAASLGA